MLHPVRLRLERGEKAAQIGAELAEAQLDVAQLLACAGQLRRQSFERRERALGGCRERCGAVALLGRERLGRALGTVRELGDMAKPLPLGPQRVLPARLEAFRHLDERGQLGEPSFLGRGSAGQLVVPLPCGGELAPGDARLPAAPELLLAAVRVEHVELVRGPGEPSLLELAGHRDQPLGCGRKVLARDCTAPGVGASSAVGEHAACEDEPRLILRCEIGETGELLVLEESLGEIELGLDICLSGGGADRPGVALRTEQQADRLGEDRLPRTGLAGDRRQPIRRRQLTLPHEDEVLDPQATKQRPGGSG